MSQYQPPYGYGQYHGQPPTPQHGYPLPPNQTNPSYSLPYDPAASGRPTSVVQSSFDYNASQIPGLGIASASSGQPHNIPTGPAAWAQTSASAFLANFQPIPSNIQSQVPMDLTRQQSRTVFPVGPPAQIVNPPLQPVSLAAHFTALNSEVEEGELSEGQFEDLYGPRESVEPTNSTKEHPKPPSAGSQSHPVSTAETPDAGFYVNDDDEGGTSKREKASGAANRERSGSYSPFLSPRDLQSNQPTPRDAVEVPEGPQTVISATQANSNQPKSVVPGLHYAAQPSPNGSAHVDAPLPAGPRQVPAAKSSAAFTSLQEAKKEAQKAILRLWPMGVKYQDYLDEGLDEKVIKALFGDLHLETSKFVQGPQTANKPTASKSTQPTEAEGQQQNQQNPQDKQLRSTSDQSKKGEERKDRIARLLAAKAAKAPTAPIQKPVPTQPRSMAMAGKLPDTAAAPTALPKPKTWGEKERLIQQKIAALQKSREAQAQKSAIDKPSSGLPLAVDGKANPSTQVPEQSDSDSKLAASSVATGSSQVPRDQQNASASLASISGLLLSSTKPGPSINQRKRPVASDFVEYSSTVEIHKRSFGQQRKETSFVIDVSDGSDDEEMEMEMEMDSPAEESSSIQTTGTSSQRGPSIRDFPPLTDTLPARQFSSPVPSPHTPLTLPNGKKRETELDMKEKAIQEMRRKIAEAEARRKAKKSSVGSQTPNNTTRTPEFKEDEFSPSSPARRLVSMGSSDRSEGPSAQLLSEATSVKLPKRCDLERLGHQEKAERRGRIVSLDLPRIDESLEEKMSRLKRLREEELRLQAEIDDNLIKKRLLTEELERLDDTPSNGTPNPNAPTSGDTSDALSSNPISMPSDARASSMSNSQVSEQSEAAGDISMDEDESSPEPSSRQTPTRQAQEPQESRIGEITVDGATQDRSDASMVDDVNNDQAVSRRASLTRTNDTDKLQETPGQPLSANGLVQVSRDAGNGSAVTGAVDQETDKAQSLQHADAPTIDDAEPMQLDSPSPSSTSTDPINNAPADGDVHQPRHSSLQLLAQISNVAQPREEVQEIESAATREINNEPERQLKRTFLPYDSPLRYFHAYRFHPRFLDTVGGGLKSLTYSNRIDPSKPLCPSELTGEPCPENCDFQHVRSAGAPDDQILLELGKADEYKGEQKARFISGLRDLLQGFRANKVKDFDTISRGIIEFRSRFLGDQSKVLHLEGVTL
ncbi:hypothetical protein B0H66DRAFT_527964 [Apodospora peruviana]|uniref:Putative zinc-finger domain-containing protein n=1 Tax=Apodospora peruviana TaxID=516989 RepID=A0AAE0MG94_9PEZI|nr:hypothetical protein B0H66DRAFT_527964 [Apodospora peruviana]